MPEFVIHHASMSCARQLINPWQSSETIEVHARGSDSGCSKQRPAPKIPTKASRSDGRCEGRPDHAANLRQRAQRRTTELLHQGQDVRRCRGSSEKLEPKVSTAPARTKRKPRLGGFSEGFGFDHGLPGSAVPNCATEFEPDDEPGREAEGAANG